MLKAILFDMDGTLLPMDADAFTKKYFGALSGKFAPRGYDPEKMIGAVWQGVLAMVKNDGAQTNEEVFWKVFSAAFGEGARADRPLFDEFYEKDFDALRAACGFNAQAGAAVASLKAAGYTLALATNPVFPMTAQKKRLAWSGAAEENFSLITSYENSRFCKPNPKYYEKILDEIGHAPDECLMVGNDVGEDMAAARLGMRTFLMTDCLINRGNADISAYPRGGFEELLGYIKTL